jgi:hypothetical protein
MRSEMRNTTQGIRLLVTRANRRPIVAGEGELPETYEATTTAAFLVPYTGELARDFDKILADRAARKAAREEIVEAQKAVILRFAAVGFEVGFDSKSNLVIDAADIPKLIETLEGRK